MKHIVLLSVVCALSPARPAQAVDAAVPTNTRTNAVWHLKISGMHCDGCAGGIRSEVQALPGVATADVRLKTADAFLAVDTNKVSTAKVLKTIEDAGFKAVLAK